MSAGIVTAGGGHAWEPDIVSALSRPAAPLTVVRRCADVADILAVAATGQIAIAVIAADLRRLDSETVHQLAGFGVDVVAVHRAGDEHLPVVLARIGVAEAVADGAGTAAILAAVTRVRARRLPGGSSSGSDGGGAGIDEAARAPGPSDGGPGAAAGPRDDDVADGSRLDPADGSTPGPAHDVRISGPEAVRDAAADAASAAGSVRSSGAASLGAPAGAGADDGGHGGAAAGASGRFVPTARWQPGVPDAAEQPETESPGTRRARATDEDATAPGRGARRRHGAGRRAHAASGHRPGAQDSSGDRADAVAGDDAPARPGRIIAVWGPGGAPGRSTVAMGLADRAVANGRSAMLIDADVYGGVLASAFGLLDESAGLAGACRLAANGRLDAAGLTALCWQVQERLVLLSGIARADRWPELRPSAIPAVLRCAATLADVVIVDLAAVLELDEEITFDTLAPRRNGATVAALQIADTVVAVGSGDPPGMERLARGYVDLATVAEGVEVRVVINRVRPGAASPSELREAAARFCGIEPVALLPEDRGAVDLAWRRGISLSEASARSPLVGALGELSRAVLTVGETV